MKNKIAYAVFTTTASGAEMLVKGGFEDDEQRAYKYKDEYERKSAMGRIMYPKFTNPLFVKKIEY